MTAERRHLKKFRFAVIVLLNIAWIVSSSSCSLRNTGASGTDPAVLTLPASSIGTDLAVLNGSMGPGGLPADVWFEYGTDPSLSTWTATTDYSAGTCKTPVRFRGSVRGLVPYKTYYFRAAARNRLGVYKGEILSFPTGEYYVALGDSITRAGGKGGYPAALSRLLEKSRGYPNFIANWGKDGATSAGGAKCVSSLLAAVPSAKYYLVMYGTNDARRPGPVPSGKGLKPRDRGYKGTYKENMQTIVTAIMAMGKVPVLAKVPFTVHPDFDVRSIREYNLVIDELAAEYKTAAVPPDFFGHFLRNPGEMPDGIHPNDAGCESMAKLWLQALGG